MTGSNNKPESHSLSFSFFLRNVLNHLQLLMGLAQVISFDDGNIYARSMGETWRKVVLLCSNFKREESAQGSVGCENSESERNHELFSTDFLLHRLPWESLWLLKRVPSPLFRGTWVQEPTAEKQFYPHSCNYEEAEVTFLQPARSFMLFSSKAKNHNRRSERKFL